MELHIHRSQAAQLAMDLPKPAVSERLSQPIEALCHEGSLSFDHDLFNGKWHLELARIELDVTIQHQALFDELTRTLIPIC